MNKQLDSSSKEKVSARSGAIIELNNFEEPISRTESNFSPLCISVAAVHSLEPCRSKSFPGVKTCVYLRKNGGGRSDTDMLEVQEDYATIKALIRRAQKTGFATFSDLESSNA